MALLLCLLLLSLAFFVVSANFDRDFDITYGADHVKILYNGQQMQLSLDKNSGSGFQSKKEILFGRLDMKIKLVPGYSAGTVTAFYLSSQGSKHDELDFEFLGRLPGEPYVMQTNVFSQGQGNREVKFNLWFDPTQDFHTYSLLWNSLQIVFFVDGTPVRVFKNLDNMGVPYPNQAMKVIGSLWDGSSWATDGGNAKVDYSKAPFIATFSSFSAEACIYNGNPCNSDAAWTRETLNSDQWAQLKMVRNKYMTYNYCSDKQRFPNGLPPECTQRT